MTITDDIREQVRQRANFACEYCGVTETDAGGELTVDHRDRPLTISLERLWNLPENLLPIVMGVITAPPVSDFLTAELAVAPRVPPLPELVRM